MRHLNAGPSRAVRSCPVLIPRWMADSGGQPRSASATELAVVRPTAVRHSSREWNGRFRDPATAERRGDRARRGPPSDGTLSTRDLPGRAVLGSTCRLQGRAPRRRAWPGPRLLPIPGRLLVVLIILTPLSVAWEWPVGISVAFLFVTLVLLLFAGQTMIFLLRLVAADRRDGRRGRSAAPRRRSASSRTPRLARPRAPTQRAARSPPGTGAAERRQSPPSRVRRCAAGR